jgi:hypothetical protein
VFSFTHFAISEALAFIQFLMITRSRFILEFFDFISNYDIQLLKYFRGYKEIISYSNKYFYQDSLQVMKIRGKSIDEVLKFSFIKHDRDIQAIKTYSIQLRGEIKCRT